MPLPHPGVMLNRLAFIARFRTLSKVACDRAGAVHACGRRGIHAVPARCPHQGASLLEAVVQGDEIVCHWHGCRYDLRDRVWRSANGARRAATP